MDQFDEDETAIQLAVGALQTTQYDDIPIPIDSAQGADAALPEPVRAFIQFFHNAVLTNNVYELNACYENTWPKLTEKFYAKSPWPDAEIVAGLVDNDENFLTLYRELYFRHIYAKMNPTLEQRFQSYDNYCDLYNWILNSEGPVDLELPNQWAWDIVDEFIYQFQSFCNYRSRIGKRTDEELSVLRENSQIWSCYSVLNVLYSLMQKSRMNEQLEAIRAGRDSASVAGEYGSKPLYRLLGYFSILGLLRVNILLGDFTLALKTMDNIDLTKNPLYPRVTSSHFSSNYYVGFAYMMMHRYADAIKSFSHILLFISRTASYNHRSNSYDQISKKAEQMYALLSICLALHPTRVDDIINSQLREKYGEKLTQMQKGDLSVFEELFNFACPKFISPLAPDYDGDASVVEPVRAHTRIFIDGIRPTLSVPQLRNFLKMYTTMSLDKVASFLEIDDPEELRSRFIVYKQKSRELRWKEGSLLAGEEDGQGDIDFALWGDIIHIAETKTGRSYATWFIRNTNKYLNMQDSLKKTKAIKSAA